MGGVQFGSDVIEFLLAGATAVGVGTALFVEPNSPVILAEYIKKYLADRGLSSPAEIVGELQLPAER